MTKDNVGVRYAPAPFCLEKGAEYFETQDFVYISKKIHLAENFFLSFSQAPLSVVARGRYGWLLSKCYAHVYGICIPFYYISLKKIIERGIV